MKIVLPKFIFIDDSSLVRLYQNNTVKSEFEYGPQKTRPLQSKPLVTYSMTISIQSIKITDFDEWFVNQLNWGTGFFFMNDPFTGVETRFRFVETQLSWMKSGTLLKCDISLEGYHAV